MAALVRKKFLPLFVLACLVLTLATVLAGCGSDTTTAIPTTVAGPPGAPGSAGSPGGPGPAGSPAPTSPLMFVFNFTVAPKASLNFASLALPGVTFTFTTNASGGTCSSAGLYVAGATGNVIDVVTASDTNGNTAQININVGPVVTISPGSGNQFPGGKITFIATGGSGTGYTWTFATDGSGGTIGSSDGTYTAGTTGSTTDTVKVTDSLGNTATANVVVGSAIGLTGGSVPPKGTLTLHATNGAGNYTYALTTNLSGGAIDPSTGVYTAGAHGGVTDVVTVHDSNFAIAFASIIVGPGISISPAPPSPSLNIAPGSSITFVASGGCNSGTTPSCGTYTWTISTNHSNAPNLPSPTTTTTTGDTVQYTAGSVGPSTDMISVVDALGNTAQVPVSVGSSLTVDSSPENTHNVLSGACLQLNATGGLFNSNGPTHTYTWSIETQVSGGSGTPASITYVAGTDTTEVVYCSGDRVAGTDIVEVTDDNGNEAFYAITVGQPLTVLPQPNITLPPNNGNCSDPHRFQVFTAIGGVPANDSPNGYDWEIDSGIGTINGGTVPISDELSVTYSVSNCAGTGGITVLTVSDNPQPVAGVTPVPHTVHIHISH